jgi:hypothetical protein
MFVKPAAMLDLSIGQIRPDMQRFPYMLVIFQKGT